MVVPYCRKHNYCVMDSKQLRHCEAQQSGLGCPSLIFLPTEKPKYERRINGNESFYRKSRKFGRN